MPGESEIMNLETLNKKDPDTEEIPNEEEPATKKVLSKGKAPV